MSEMKAIIQKIEPGEHITRNPEGHFSSVLIRGDDTFKDFLAQGGAADITSLRRFILSKLDREYVEEIASGLMLHSRNGGCSVCNVRSDRGGYLFGRNFDFQRSNMLIVKSEPVTGYASLSTVNPDFIGMRTGQSIFDEKYERLLRLMAVYMPVDGMNEKGLCVSVNKIRDEEITQQTHPGRTDQTASTLLRTMLDCAEDVDEAVEILERTNYHSFEGGVLHFAVADAKGRSVCVEYIDNLLHIIDSPVVTNFYLTEGEKHGIGTYQSQLRYRKLCDTIREKDLKNEGFSREELKKALSSVAKSNYKVDGELYTEWSVIYDRNELSAQYYRREDYEHGYEIFL